MEEEVVDGIAGKNHYNYGKPSYNRGKKESNTQKEKISKSLKETYKKYGKNGWSETQRINYYNTLNNRTEKQKAELNSKLSKSLKGINKGRIRVTKNNVVRKILPEQLDEFLANGWVRTKKTKKLSQTKGGPKGKIWINKNRTNKYIVPEQLDEFLANGWTKGIYRNTVYSEESRKKMSISQKKRFKKHSVWNKGMTKKEMIEYGNR